MKRFMLVFAISMSFMAFSQTHYLPQAVVNSFNKTFPNQLISSWTDNSAYNYENDWNDDAYYDDFNYDGYPDEYFYGYSSGDPYIDDSGITSPYYGSDDYYNGYEYTIPDNYQTPSYNRPTQYQINFKLNGSYMASIFKSNGAFVIAKGRIGRLPVNVHNVVMKIFKGKTFRIANHIEEMITPNYPISNPVYRVKVGIRHGDNHILKIDATGKVVSNNKI